MRQLNARRKTKHVVILAFYAVTESSLVLVFNKNILWKQINYHITSAYFKYAVAVCGPKSRLCQSVHFILAHREL
jgi:hypothetical protein